MKSGLLIHLKLWALSLLGATALASVEDIPQITLPEALTDDEHIREELGINEFTAPSIRKIFENLSNLPPIPQSQLTREKIDKLPIDRADLALELGFLMADGFILVQGGKLNEIRPLAQEISRYAKALGAGEKVNRHAATLLQLAEDGKSDELKKELALTQKDVEDELISLRDPDLAQFIGLGGWIRAITTATATLEEEFSAEKAKILFQPDVPEYFDYALGSLDPLMLKRKDISTMRKLLTRMQTEMTLEEGKDPTKENIKKLAETTKELSKTALSRIMK